jgi:hypothetical protein
MDALDADDFSLNSVSDHVQRGDGDAKPLNVATGLLERFLPTLQCELIANAYREIASEILSKHATYWNEFKSIQKAEQRGKNSWPGYCDVKITLQPTDRVKESMVYKALAATADAASRRLSKDKRDLLHRMKVMNNMDRKVELLEIVVRSIARMSNMILIDAGIPDYGKHNLVADVLTLHSEAFTSNLEATVADFTECYRRVNACGAAPESHKDMYKRRFPPQVAPGDSSNKVTATAAAETPQQQSGVATTVPPSKNSSVADTPLIAQNLQTPLLVTGLPTPKTASTVPTGTVNKMAGTDFVTASDIAVLITALKNPTGTNTSALADLIKNNQEIARALTAASQIADASTAVGAATAASSKKVLSPVRKFVNPYTNQVYFSRQHTEEELSELEEERLKADRLSHCFFLCQVNSIREQNYVEGSKKIPHTNEKNPPPEDPSPDPAKKRLDYESLVPHDDNDALANKVEKAVNSLSHDIKRIIFDPKKLYLRQHEFNCKIKDLRKSESELKSNNLAAAAADNLIKENDPKAASRTTGEIVVQQVSKVDRKHTITTAGLQAQLNEIKGNFGNQIVQLNAKLKSEKKRRLELEHLLKQQEEESSQSSSSSSASSVQSAVDPPLDSQLTNQGASTVGASQRNSNGNTRTRPSKKSKKPAVTFETTAPPPNSQTIKRNELQVKKGPHGDGRAADIHARARRNRKRKQPSKPRDASEAGSTDVAPPSRSRRNSKNKHRKNFNNKYVRSQDAKP